MVSDREIVSYGAQKVQIVHASCVVGVKRAQTVVHRSALDIRSFEVMNKLSGLLAELLRQEAKQSTNLSN